MDKLIKCVGNVALAWTDYLKQIPAAMDRRFGSLPLDELEEMPDQGMVLRGTHTYNSEKKNKLPICRNQLRDLRSPVQSILFQFCLSQTK